MDADILLPDYKYLTRELTSVLKAVEKICDVAFRRDPSGRGGRYRGAVQLFNRVHSVIDSVDELILLREVSVECLTDAVRSGDLICRL